MTEFSGRCLCGDISYRGNGDLIAPHFCHCRDCQMISGAAFTAGFIVVDEQFAFTGAPTAFTKTSDSGGEKTHLFCGRCGTPLAEKADAFPGVSVLMPGTLDDPTLFKPEAHYWVKSNPSWNTIADDLEQLETQPGG